MLKPPLCPSGYEWIPTLGRSCYKITEEGNDVFETNGQMYVVKDQHKADKMCLQDSTRLASLRNDAEYEILRDWFKAKMDGSLHNLPNCYSSNSCQGVGFWLGIKTKEDEKIIFNDEYDN